jgi:hypothetical protein
MSFFNQLTGAKPKQPKSESVTGIAALLPNGNRVPAYPGVFRALPQSEDEPDLYVHLRLCKKTGRVHQCTNQPVPGDLTEAMRLDLAEFLSSITGAKLRPAQDGTPFVYGYVPRTSEEVDLVERVLTDLVWFYDQFPRDEDGHFGSPAYGHDDWPYLVRRANTIREKYNLPADRPFSELEWAALKVKLDAIRWMRGCGWDGFDD